MLSLISPRLRNPVTTLAWLATALTLGCGQGKDSGGQPGGPSTGGGGGSVLWDGSAKPAADADNSVPTAETVLFKMESVQGVGRNPTVATIFTLSRPSTITRVMTYHYTEIIGARQPTVAFKDTTTGKTYGPWSQIGYTSFNSAPGVGRNDPGQVLGPPDNYWIAYPNEMVPAGTYQVIDSDPKTWCYTADLGNRGVAWVWGWLGGAPSGNLDGGGQGDAGVAIDAPAGDASKTVDAPISDGKIVTTVDANADAITAIAGTVAVNFSPGGGLLASDYQVFGTLGPDPIDVSADAGVTAAVNQARAGFLSATPKAGSATAAKLAAESGLYMSPAPGSSRLTKNGTVWSVGTTGTAAMDATSTVMSLLLLHPMTATVDAEIQTQQLQWIVTTANSSWGNLEFAASAYDKALAAGLDPFADASFTSYLSSCVAFMGDSMPTFKSTRYGLDVHSPPGSGTPYSVVERGMTVTALNEIARGASSVTLQPTTVNRTGIDYYYQVEEIAPSAMTQGLKSDYYANAALLQMPPKGKIVGTGFLAADSRWKYLDAGHDLELLQNYLLSKTVGPPPGSTVELTAPMFYQIRFFSGGFGVGNYAATYDFVSKNFQTEAQAAFRHNVTVAVLEFLFLVPLAGQLMESEMASEVIKAAVEEAAKQLSELFNASGGNISPEAVAQLIYNVCQTTVNTMAEQAAKAGLLTKAKQSFKDWFLAGGKKALKAVLALPSKVSKGGALASRAYNLVTPESIMEYYVVAVGVTDQPDAGVPTTGKKYTMSYQMQNNPHPFTDIGCYGGCGDMSTPLANATGVLTISGDKASFTSSYTLQDEILDTVTCTVAGSGTWQDSPSMVLSLSGTFSCTAATHKETGTFTSSSDWISMSAGYLQPLSTPVWKATFQSQGDECSSTCAGDVKFKPLRLTPQ